MYSKTKNAPSDFALISAFKKLKIKFKLYSFNERGSDERQFNWPGIDVPMTSFLDQNMVNFQNITHQKILLEKL